MVLNDIKIKALKAKDKAYKVFDGNGLYIYVLPSGQKKWRIKYRFEKKEQTYSVGDYPQVSLREARVKVLEVKGMLAQGINPALEKKKNIPTVPFEDSKCFISKC